MAGLIGGVDVYIHDAQGVSLHAVPKPATLALLGCGALLILRRHRTA